MTESYLVILVPGYWNADSYYELDSLESAKARVLELFRENKICLILHIKDSRITERISWTRPYFCDMGKSEAEQNTWAWCTIEV